MTQTGSIELRQVRKYYDGTVAVENLTMTVHPGEFFALVGPSGSGKTTSLRIIAGLESADSGHVLIDGADVTQRSPGERDIAMVFQNYALYPHMTVRQNVGFPLKMTKVPQKEIDERVKKAARQVKMEDLLERRPGQLSGGQQQRVALARAIVREPTIFLLDEPLSNLDAQLRLETRVAIKKLQLDLDVTTVYVTHDQEEAVSLADRMAMFMNGEVIQVGRPQELFDNPERVEVAAFLGRPPMNLVLGTVGSDGLRIEGWDRVLPLFRPGPAQKVTVGFRPRDLELVDRGTRATVYLSEVMGEHTIINLRCGDNLIKAQVETALRLAVGAEVALQVQPQHFHLFDRKTGRRVEASRDSVPST